MVERFNVVSISLFKCCVACSDCGLVNYVFSHAFFLERACFLVRFKSDIETTLNLSMYA